MRAAVTSIGVLVLTTVHHLYGAAIYRTPWRHHVAVVAGAVAVILVITLAVARLRPGTVSGRAAGWMFVIVAAVYAVGVIGMFEGGYNHVVKDLMYLGRLAGDDAEALSSSDICDARRPVVRGLGRTAVFPRGACRI